MVVAVDNRLKDLQDRYNEFPYSLTMVVVR